MSNIPTLNMLKISKIKIEKVIIEKEFRIKAKNELNNSLITRIKNDNQIFKSFVYFCKSINTDCFVFFI